MYGSCGREIALRRQRRSGQELSLAFGRDFGTGSIGRRCCSWRAPVELQLLDHGFLAKQGDDRSMRVVKIAAHRGAITDRNGEPPRGLDAGRQRVGQSAGTQ